jgi:hypothetical protein
MCYCGLTFFLVESFTRGGRLGSRCPLGVLRNLNIRYIYRDNHEEMHLRTNCGDSVGFKFSNRVRTNLLVRLVVEADSYPLKLRLHLRLSSFWSYSFSRVTFHVWITVFVFRLFFPYLGFARHLFLGEFVFLITLLHRSFLIKCADSDTPESVGARACHRSSRSQPARSLLYFLPRVVPIKVFLRPQLFG